MFSHKHPRIECTKSTTQRHENLFTPGTISNMLDKKRGAQNGIATNPADGENVLFVQCRISTQRIRVMGHVEMVDRMIEKNDWSSALEVAKKKLKNEECAVLLRRRVRDSIGSLKIRYDEAQSEQMIRDLASESISFCISISRCDDLLFREIFAVYEERNRRRGETGERVDFVAIFLESVLPFIKSGRLVKLSAEIMQRFVSHFCDMKRFQEVEACVVRVLATHSNKNGNTKHHNTHKPRYVWTPCKWI